MATPENSSLVAQSLMTGQTKELSVYASDVPAAYARIEASGSLAGATSPDYYRAPVPMVLVDFSQTTGMTATVGYSVMINGVAIGHTIDKITHVSTAPQRPKLAIKLNAGDELRLMQI